MNRSERKSIVDWANSLSDEELENEYYKSVFDSLGSEVEEMYERGWDMQDILEREKFEKWLGEKSDILASICEERGIKLWEEETPDDKLSDADERSSEYEFISRLNELKEEYASKRGWNEEDPYWYENDEHLYEAECYAYEILEKETKENGVSLEDKLSYATERSASTENTVLDKKDFTKE